MFESLEERRLLSGVTQQPAGVGAHFQPKAHGPAKIVQTGAILTINNAHDVDVIDGLNPGLVDVFDFGGKTQTSYAGVTTLIINGTQSGDIITVGNDMLKITINAGGGGDTIIVADNGTGSTVVYGGAGNDSILVGDPSFNTGTKVFGEAGDDVYSGPPGVFTQ
jgi:Ca2+-binding RTX toxin-like protein